MKRIEKLYEALSIITECERPLFMKFSGLKLASKDQQRLMSHAKALTAACEAFENELLAMIQESKAQDALKGGK
jgi:hypothetical protein